MFPGFPQPEYRWMKDGSFLSDYTPEHFYKIQSISKEDAGNYQCYAKNEVGVIVSEKIPITVACKKFIIKMNKQIKWTRLNSVPLVMSPFNEEQAEDIQVKAGHAAVFDLPPIESVPAPSVTWQAEDDSLLYGTKYATTEDNKFVILSVDSSDEKRYR